MSYAYRPDLKVSFFFMPIADGAWGGWAPSDADADADGAGRGDCDCCGGAAAVIILAGKAKAATALLLAAARMPAAETFGSGLGQGGEKGACLLAGPCEGQVKKKRALRATEVSRVRTITQFQSRDPPSVSFRHLTRTGNTAVRQALDRLEQTTAHWAALGRIAVGDATGFCRIWCRPTRPAARAHSLTVSRTMAWGWAGPRRAARRAGPPCHAICRPRAKSECVSACYCQWSSWRHAAPSTSGVLRWPIARVREFTLLAVCKPVDWFWSQWLNPENRAGLWSKLLPDRSRRGHPCGGSPARQPPPEPAVDIRERVSCPGRRSECESRTA
jgi:hypothetical protein